MTEIASRLYVGDDDNAKDLKWLKSKGITHIVNCAQELKFYFPKKFVYLGLNLQDAENESLFPKACIASKFIDKALKEKGVVLVHCYAGMSRSVSVCCYYLMAKRGKSYSEVISMIKGKRRVASPNRGYARQLRSDKTRCKKGS